MKSLALTILALSPVDPEDAQEDSQQWGAGMSHEGWRHALIALDCVRVGDWIEAAETLTGRKVGRDLKEHLIDLEDPEDWRFRCWDDFDRHLRSLLERADDLEELGL